MFLFSLEYESKYSISMYKIIYYCCRFAFVRVVIFSLCGGVLKNKFSDAEFSNVADGQKMPPQKHSNPKY
jgi:hypothetical protein